MTFPGSGGGNFFEQILGDLIKVMGGSSSGARVDVARTWAQQIAAGSEPERNVDPSERIQIEQLAHVAELHVTELTGLSVTPTGVPLELMAVTPGLWAWHTVDDWRFLLEAMSAPAPPADGTSPAGGTAVRPSDPGATGPDQGEGTPGVRPGDELEEYPGAPGPEMFARWMATFGPMLAAIQLGSAVGHLARSTLGPFELPVPRPTPRLLVVPANIVAFAEGWSLPPDEVRLWVCLREQTVQAVLSRPFVAERLRQLLVEVVHGTAAEAGEVMERFQGLDLSDPESLQRILSDPTALAEIEEPSPARERAVADLMAVTAALLGYVEHVLDQAAHRLLGGRSAIREAWRRRQVGRETADRAAEAMLGLDLGPVQIDRGSDFVRGVLERAGEEGLARLWSAAHTLPTPAEVDAPGLWLERIDLAPSP